MSPRSTRSTYAWIVVAHVIGAGLLGAVEAGRLGGSLGLVLVPLFALTGLVAGAITALVEQRVAPREHRGGRARWIAAFAIAAPSLLVTIPVCSTLFDGAQAQTLPLAGALPYLTPVVVWLACAAALVVGRWLARGDLILRAIAIMAVGGAIGAILWSTRHLLGSGYPGAHTGATLAVIVLAGVVVRLARRGSVPVVAAAAIAAIVLGTSVAAITDGLEVEFERRTIATYGDQSRDLVRLYRTLLDRDRDGSSAVLGGGDCDDRDPDRHPGAPDLAGDGIDQDCDGFDAMIARPPVAPRAVEVKSWRESGPPRGLLERTRTMNIVVITVDALRFDVLAPGAPRREEFPRLTKLLDESVWFTHAVAPGSGTDVSLGTMLTGRFDPYQAVETTLPEAARALGRYTASSMPAEVLRHVGEVLLGRGFEHVGVVHTDWEREDVGDHVSAGATTDEALKTIDAAKGRPFLMWAHYFDVHEHHQIDPPGELRRMVSDGGSPIVHRYRAMLFAVDRSIGRLLDTLDARGLRDQTIIVFASDHGESLREDPRFLDTHGIVAYGPLVRIPLAMRVPGVTPGQRADMVSLVDVTPTLLELLGAPHAITPLDGIDLLPALLDGPAALRPAADRAIVIHEEQQWSVVEWPYQLLVKPGDDLVELYDLERDPFERDDLAARQPALTRRLRARYAEVPSVRVDRTLDGRVLREQLAQPPQRRARP